jgi:hypothetical protein
MQVYYNNLIPHLLFVERYGTYNKNSHIQNLLLIKYAFRCLFDTFTKIHIGCLIVHS